MTYADQRVLAVIPARGGSKGIPRKNLAKVNGRSLVEHVARVVADLPWLDAAVLSTDDDEIAEEGRRHGLAVPFRRPDDLADDVASSVAMWRHAWTASEAAFGRIFDVSLLLEPTSPLRTAEDVERTLAALVGSKCSAAATVSRTPAHFSLQKTLVIDAAGIIGFAHPDGARITRRQQLPPYFYRNGACYALHRSTLMDGGTIIESNCVAVVINRPLVNIDEPIDLDFADLLARKQGLS